MPCEEKELKDLILPVKREYFKAIKSGDKTEENRLKNDYWTKRLLNKKFRNVIITLGYPSKHDKSRRLSFQYQGYKIKTIQHKHFGDKPVEVYAIRLR